MTGTDHGVGLGVGSGRADGKESGTGNKEKNPRRLGVGSVESVIGTRLRSEPVGSARNGCGSGVSRVVLAAAVLGLQAGRR
jgi:hypothetical protein